MIRRYAEGLYRRSPADIAASLRRRFFPPRDTDGNSVIDALLDLPDVEKLLAWKLRKVPGPIVYLSDEWDWKDPLPDADALSTFVLLRAPSTAGHWRAIARLREEHGASLVTCGELLLPYSRIVALQRALPYYIPTFEEIAPFYLGERFFGPLQELDHVYSLNGRTVIEFGPFDGCQTLGLLHLGAAHVTAIEARAENALKTQAAVDAFDFAERVSIVMDDMHNFTDAYGRYDLAFAHGVYYHSAAPFVFLTNLLGLANAVFVGGFCATDTLPATPWETLAHEGRAYRVKSYRESDEHYTGGVNRVGYFFHKEDLTRFFTERGYDVVVVTDEPSAVTAGNFTRFLARSPVDGARTRRRPRGGFPGISGAAGSPF